MIPKDFFYEKKKVQGSNIFATFQAMQQCGLCPPIGLASHGTLHFVDKRCPEAEFAFFFVHTKINQKVHKLAEIQQNKHYVTVPRLVSSN